MYNVDSISVTQCMCTVCIGCVVFCSEAFVTFETPGIAKTVQKEVS